MCVKQQKRGGAHFWDISGLRDSTTVLSPVLAGRGRGGKCNFSSLKCHETVLAWLSGERGRAQARESTILGLFGPDKLLSCTPPRVGRGGRGTSAGESLGF